MTLLLQRCVWLTVGGVAVVSVLALGSSRGWHRMLQLEKQLDQLAPAENQPPNRPLDELLVAGSVSTEEMASLAQFYEATHYWVLPAGVTIVEGEAGAVSVIGVGQLTDWTDLFFGDAVEIGASVANGLLHNTGSQPLLVALKGAPDAEPIQIAPGGMVAVGRFINDFEAIGRPSTCSIKCGTGYYSCCCVNSDSRCLCIAIGSDPGAPCFDCDAGGVGSTGCSISCEPDPGPG